MITIIIIIFFVWGVQSSFPQQENNDASQHEPKFHLPLSMSLTWDIENICLQCLRALALQKTCFPFNGPQKSTCFEDAFFGVL